MKIHDFAGFHVSMGFPPLFVFGSVSGPPGRLKNINIPEDKRIKIGGMVLESSVVREQSKVIFTVTDYKNYIEVVYEGIVPDLFKEGSGVVALGFIQNETFYAQEVLAKHDENYMPPNLNINNDN